ncbi:hypothetical protein LWC34_12385 [Kibdelosporangium philippinense]|uniref:D-ribose pyranase n=1 Tax=Kibdelosporangium philippinense TaxID=211113 RepID=A0ABS8ZAR2_9PSEU|nr:RbsD/FucU domain-containing protein [Kibdelosporangium philippinense]MCE7003618.1 hypothetical protein [Kibdelosporangium philippinense]
MLKGIDPVFGPELLAPLARMGHADQLAIVDLNYPAYSARQPVVRIHGHSAPEFMTKLGTLLPVDDFVEHPITYMRDPDHADAPNEVQREFIDEAQRAEGRPLGAVALDRLAFYKRCTEVSVVVVTDEFRPYGCFLVAKGVVR